MTKSQYAKKLKDPRWDTKRREILTRDKCNCAACGAEDEPMHVHHREYSEGGDPWDVPNDWLITLCEGCHAREHSGELDWMDELFDRELLSKGNYARVEVLGMIEAMSQLLDMSGRPPQNFRVILKWLSRERPDPVQMRIDTLVDFYLLEKQQAQEGS